MQKSAFLFERPPAKHQSLLHHRRGSSTRHKMALTRDELATLLIFQRITDSWVREVHRFESMRKKKQNFVIFRDANNRKLTSLAELKVILRSDNFF